MSRRSSSSRPASGAKNAFEFRPAASKKSAASSKVVSFDEIDEQTVTRPRRAARKPKSNVQPSTPELPPSPEAVERSKSRKRPASTKKATPKQVVTPTEKASQDEDKHKKQKITSRYPVIDMDAAQYRNSAGDSHKQALVKIVKDVCSVELEGLKRYFTNQEGKSDILKSMQSVLEELPRLVNDEVGEPVTYKPERQLNDARAMHECDESIRQLTKQQTRLQGLLGNLEDCGEQFDIMLHVPREEEEGVRPSPDTEEVLNGFKTQLDQMTQSVESLKEEASSISDIMSKACDVQGTLYDTYQATTRFEGVHRGGAKDAVKQLTQLA